MQLYNVDIRLSDEENGGLKVNWKVDPDVDLDKPCQSQAVFAAMKIIELLQQLAQAAAESQNALINPQPRN